MCSFDNTYITINSGTTSANTVNIKANKSYNFAGYSNLKITLRIAKLYAGTGSQYVHMTGGSELKYNLKDASNLAAGNEYTVTFSLVNNQKTFVPVFEFETRSGIWQIKRIRLE